MAGKAKVINFLKTTKGFVQLININKVKILSAGGGNCTGKFKVEPEHTNDVGTLHGGFSATLVDVISMMAFFTHEKGDGSYVSTKIDLSFLKPAKVGDDVIVDAKTVRAGKSLAFLEVDIKNEKSGELMVKGFHTVYIFPDR